MFHITELWLYVRNVMLEAMLAESSVSVATLALSFDLEDCECL